jgi:hypothetical protein
VNWRKLRREELAAYRGADGVYLCSAVDERRLLGETPNIRTTVIPNAADVEYYQRAPQTQHRTAAAWSSSGSSLMLRMSTA